MLKNALNLFYNNRRWIAKHALYFLYYILVLLVSSLHILATLLVNFSLIIYIFVFAETSTPSKQSSTVCITHIYMFVLAIGNYLIFIIMVNSYAELLPWELGFHTLFYAMSALYLYWCRERALIFNDDCKRSFDIKSYVCFFFHEIFLLYFNGLG